MKPDTAAKPGHGVQNGPMPGVTNGAKGAPVHGGPKAPAPNKGQTGGSRQGGDTSPRTDGGGGVGNSAADLDRMLRK